MCRPTFSHPQIVASRIACFQCVELYMKLHVYPRSPLALWSPNRRILAIGAPNHIRPKLTKADPRHQGKPGEGQQVRRLRCEHSCADRGPRRED